MGTYTINLKDKQKTIDAESEDLYEQLLELSCSFRTFEEGLDEIIREHGYDGELTDVSGKTAFLKSSFKKAGVPVPREIDKWYPEHMIIKRPTAFRLCFALNMKLYEVNDFFQRILMERSFDCHDVIELVYYYCFYNGKGYQEAESILKQVTVFKTKDRVDLNKIDTIIYTEVIRDDVEEICSDEELITYINENQDRFRYNNARGTETVQGLWYGKNNIPGTRELALKESEAFDMSDYGVHLSDQKKNHKLISEHDVYLAIFDFEPQSAAKVFNDRSIIPILRNLHPMIRDCFPSRESLTKILNRRKVNYETIRKMIIFLAFYNYWADWKLKNQSKNRSDPPDKDTHRRYEDQMFNYLIDAGFEELYLGNPYDFIFLFCNTQDDPLDTFRIIMGELLEKADRPTG